MADSSLERVNRHTEKMKSEGLKQIRVWTKPERVEDVKNFAAGFKIESTGETTQQLEQQLKIKEYVNVRLEAKIRRVADRLAEAETLLKEGGQSKQKDAMYIAPEKAAIVEAFIKAQNAAQEAINKRK